MNKTITIGSAALFTIIFISAIVVKPTAAAPKSDKSPKPIAAKYQPQELLVKFKPGIGKNKIDSIAKGHGAIKIKSFKPLRGKHGLPIERWRQIKVGKKTDIKKTLAHLSRHPSVEAVELNFVHTPHLLPDDPSFSEQWGLDNDGLPFGQDDADIDAPEAWELTTGSREVIIAVIDSGIDYNHPDLAANIWQNQDEIAGNGIDDDDNGYIDDIRGYNFAADNADVFDYETHGTHVAGIIGASSNNSVGVSGVSWNVQLMPLRFFGGPESGSNAAAVNAILYAIDNGARVINASWGGSTYSQILADAIAAANDEGVLFVASAGNDEVDNDVYRSYPASYELPNIISVAASTYYDSPANFTNYGRYSVDLMAPGYQIISTTVTNSYQTFSGTSMAAPHVTGVAALLLSQDPMRNAARLKDAILNTVDPSHPNFRYLSLSGGRLNAFNALSCLPSALALQFQSPVPSFTNAFPAEGLSIQTRVSSCDISINDALVTVSFDNGEADLALFDDGQHNDGAAGDGVYANTWLPQAAGKVVMTATASHSSLIATSDSREGHVREHMSYKQVPTTYNWIDTSSGTVHPLTDESNVTIPIGFDFNFYGVTRSTITISDNGYLTFGSAVPFFDYLNADMPQWPLPNDIIAPYWDDFHLTKGGQVVSLLEGTTPNRRLTIAWVDVPHYYSLGAALDAASFQATLYEESGDIVFNYKDTDFGTFGDDFTSGISATVGLEDPSGEEATLYTFDDPIVFNETAIRYYRIPYAPGPDNRWPFAKINLPSYINVPRNYVYTFDGSPSYDPDNDPFSYSWNLGDGTTASGPSPSHAYSSSGVYNIRLVVNDGEFDSEPYNATLNIYNRLPAARIWAPYSADKKTEVTMSGAKSTDDDGDPLTYSWDFGDGTSASGDNVTHTYTQTGSYTITMKVFDGEDWSLPATENITINNNQPFAILGGPYYATPNQVIQFDGSASYDKDNDPLAYRWDFGDGTTGTGPTPTHQYSSNGYYTVSLIVNDGEEDSVTRNTTATIKNLAPTANAGGPYNGFKNQAIVFDGSASSDPDGDALSYYWGFGGNTTVSGVAPSYVFTSAGTYTVTLRVSDGSTGSGLDSAVVTVVDQAPIANAGGPYSGLKNQAIVFDGSASNDPDGDDLSYSWNFGDGTSGSGSNPSHTYSLHGDYTVSLTVSDGQNSVTATTIVTITNQAPVANTGGPYSGLKNQAIIFDGLASSDPDGDALTYSWNFGDGKTGSGITPSHVYYSGGTYTVTLQVSDGNIASAPVSTTVTVVNQAPVANAGGPYSGWKNDNITISGALSSDPDGDSLQYKWSFNNSYSTSPTASFRSSTSGTFTIQLWVNDGEVDSAPVSTTVTVSNRPPLADAGPDQSVTPSSTVYLDGTNSYDPDEPINQISWQQLSGPAVTLVNPNVLSTSFTTPKVKGKNTELLVFELTVTDAEGVTASDQVTITVAR